MLFCNRVSPLLIPLLAFLALPIVAQPSLDDLYRGRQYFDLRAQVEKAPDSDSLVFFRGVVANRFNHLTDSIALLQKYVQGSDDRFKKEAFETLADDYLKTYQYARAADTYKILVDRSGDRADGGRLADYRNSFGLWNALRNMPAQSSDVGHGTIIQGTRDKANLLNVGVKVAGQKMDFVFDTGANLSTITVSTANKLGLTLIESDVSVGSTSEIKVKSKLAVAPELKLGDIVVRNAVFLVMEDKALAFPVISYQINGIIGMPIIESLGRIEIKRNDTVSVTETQVATKEPNMCLEGLKPLVRATTNGTGMTFSLDSGAKTTDFYPLFFEANKEQILRESKPQNIKLGGAGGVKDVTAYFMKHLDLTIAGKSAHFPSAQVITTGLSESSRKLFGNLGQDLIKQFDRMTLDFRLMRLEFD